MTRRRLLPAALMIASAFGLTIAIPRAFADHHVPAPGHAVAPTVHVLAIGYVEPIEGREFIPGKSPDGARRVAGTIVLIEAHDALIVGDPGMVTHQQVITDALAEHGYQPGDVTHVFVSHHHPDHTLNVGMFPNAAVVDGVATYRGDLIEDHPSTHAIAPGVLVTQTPGHTVEDATLLATTPMGMVAFTHLWWDENQQPEVDPIAEAPDQLTEQRRRILNLADIIIPGHGRPFVNPDGPRKLDPTTDLSAMIPTDSDTPAASHATTQPATD
ncbi:MAG: MBL fold metallo-hydrolase [Planctomycetota bacterium]